jgi:hypothetical protein
MVRPAKGRDVSDPTLATRFGLVEASKPGYPARTQQNVTDADATVAFLLTPPGKSTGTAKTIGFAQTGKWQAASTTKAKGGYRPVLVINSADVERGEQHIANKIRGFIRQTGAKTLNVAGHHEGSVPGVNMEDLVRGSLRSALGGGAPSTGAPPQETAPAQPAPTPPVSAPTKSSAQHAPISLSTAEPVSSAERAAARAAAAVAQLGHEASAPAVHPTTPTTPTPAATPSQGRPQFTERGHVVGGVTEWDAMGRPTLVGGEVIQDPLGRTIRPQRNPELVASETDKAMRIIAAMRSLEEASGPREAEFAQQALEELEDIAPSVGTPGKSDYRPGLGEALTMGSPAAMLAAWTRSVSKRSPGRRMAKARGMFSPSSRQDLGPFMRDYPADLQVVSLIQAMFPKPTGMKAGGLNMASGGRGGASAPKLSPEEILRTTRSPEELRAELASYRRSEAFAKQYAKENAGKEGVDPFEVAHPAMAAGVARAGELRKAIENIEKVRGRASAGTYRGKVPFPKAEGTTGEILARGEELADPRNWPMGSPEAAAERDALQAESSKIRAWLYENEPELFEQFMAAVAGLGAANRAWGQQYNRLPIGAEQPYSAAINNAVGDIDKGTLEENARRDRAVAELRLRKQAESEERLRNLGITGMAMGGAMQGGGYKQGERWYRGGSSLQDLWLPGSYVDPQTHRRDNESYATLGEGLYLTNLESHPYSILTPERAPRRWREDPRMRPYDLRGDPRFSKNQTGGLRDRLMQARIQRLMDEGRTAESQAQQRQLEQLRGGWSRPSAMSDLEKVADSAIHVTKVGEQGPEALVDMPGGQFVVPNHQMSPFMKLLQEKRLPAKDFTSRAMGGEFQVVDRDVAGVSHQFIAPARPNPAIKERVSLASRNDRPIFTDVEYGDYGPGSYVEGRDPKIHISATADEALKTLETVNEVAKKMAVPFKYVGRLGELMDVDPAQTHNLLAGKSKPGIFGPGGPQQGKFLTVYPPPAQAREVAMALHAALKQAGVGKNAAVAPSEIRFSPETPMTHRSSAGARYGASGGYGPGNPDVIGTITPEEEAVSGAAPPPPTPGTPRPPTGLRCRMDEAPRAVSSASSAQHAPPPTPISMIPEWWHAPPPPPISLSTAEPTPGTSRPPPSTDWGFDENLRWGRGRRTPYPGMAMPFAPPPPGPFAHRFGRNFGRGGSPFWRQHRGAGGRFGGGWDFTGQPLDMFPLDQPPPRPPFRRDRDWMFPSPRGRYSFVGRRGQEIKEFQQGGTIQGYGNIQRVYVVNMPAGLGGLKGEKEAAQGGPRQPSAQQNAQTTNRTPTNTGQPGNAAGTGTPISGRNPTINALSKLTATEAGSAAYQLSERLAKVGIDISEALQKSPVRALSVAFGQIAQTMIGGRAGILERARLAQFSERRAAVAVRQVGALEDNIESLNLQLEAYDERAQRNNGLTNKEIDARAEVIKSLQENKDALRDVKPRAEQRVAEAEAASKGILSPFQQFKAQAVGVGGIVGGTLLFTAAMHAAQAGLELVGDVALKAADAMDNFGVTARRTSSTLADAITAASGNVEGAIGGYAGRYGLTKEEISALTEQATRMSAVANYQQQRDLLRSEGYYADRAENRGAVIAGLGTGFNNGWGGTFINQQQGMAELIGGQLTPVPDVPVIPYQGGPSMTSGPTGTSNAATALPDIETYREAVQNEYGLGAVGPLVNPFQLQAAPSEAEFMASLNRGRPEPLGVAQVSQMSGQELNDLIMEQAKDWMGSLLPTYAPPDQSDMATKLLRYRFETPDAVQLAKQERAVQEATAAGKSAEEAHDAALEERTEAFKKNNAEAKRLNTQLIEMGNSFKWVTTESSKEIDAFAKVLEEAGVSGAVINQYREAKMVLRAPTGEVANAGELNRAWQDIADRVLKPRVIGLLDEMNQGVIAQVDAMKRQYEFQRQTLIPAGVAEQLIAQPFPQSATTGVTAPGISPASQGAKDYSAAIERVRGNLEAIRDEGLTQLENLGVPPTVIKSVQALGTSIVALQSKAENLQLGLEQAQYNEQIRITVRQVSDLMALTGKAGSEYGRLQRQQIMDSRELTRLQLARSQRELNLQIALSKLRAPGETAEERAVRRREAELLAREQQRELDIGKRTSERGFRIQDIEFGRQLTDAVKQLGLLRQARAVSIEVRGIQKLIEAKQQMMAVKQAYLESFKDSGVQLWNTANQIRQTLETTLGKLTKTEIKTLNDYLSGVKEAFGQVGFTFTFTGGTEEKEGSGGTGGGGRRAITAAGGIYPTLGATRFIAGEAGAETVVVLRNPRHGSMMGGPAGFSGGGGGNVNIMMTLNAEVRGEADENRLARKVARMLHEEVSLLVGA